ncbi:hypothetical protein G5714_017644 [Onychostoma macrolepis]|uniref:Uncharacterized protein n=1 Tax=Onychostoma macrolepis TaxID=369639 RepID=A0A7J6C5X8_9TELE|nr:hypothetical protein G5714_017644 [Onychostoma macrolepis]
MHGLPCSALQYCFGGPPDVSADPASYQDPELSKTGPDPAMGLAVLTQPGPIKPVRTDSQPSFSCVSIQTKTNGTNSKTKELDTENQDTLHSYPSSEGLSEEDDAQDRSPDLDTKRPHIPRPSIIRPQKVQFIYPLSEIQEIVGQGGNDAGQLLVVQAGCQVSTCVTVSLFLSLPLQVVGCFGLKDVHHRALPGFRVVLVSWPGWMSVECLRHTGTLGGTPERERGRRQVQVRTEAVWGTAL